MEQLAVIVYTIACMIIGYYLGKGKRDIDYQDGYVRGWSDKVYTGGRDRDE